MYLFGASGHAKVILDILKSNNINVECLIDDNNLIFELSGLMVIHNRVDLNPIIISVGDNSARKSIANRLKGPFGTAVHTSAIISNTASIGCGTVIMHGAIIQAETQIGEHCIVNTAASIDHECKIADFVHISPHATLCGNVCVGEGAWVGAGSVIIPGVKIGKWCVIGAGAVVVKDIPDGCTAVGAPAKIIKIKE